MDPILLVILVAAIGGAIKSVLGYVPSDDGFSIKRFIKTILLASIAGSALVFFTKVQGVENLMPTMGFYVETFFISIGAASTINAMTGKKLTE